MSAVSGVISRQVLPVCGSLCILCPALRARSRQPVKRYKKLISDIFPRNQVGILPIFPSSIRLMLTCFASSCLKRLDFDFNKLIFNFLQLLRL